MSRYRLLYPNPYRQEVEPSGGYVEAEPGYDQEREAANVETAIFLARHGYKVRLLIAIDLPKIRTPDAYLVCRSVQIEFKHNQEPTVSAIDRELRSAKGQAENVLLHVSSTIKKGHLLQAIKARTQQIQSLKRLWIIWKATLCCFTRKEILNGTIDRKIQ